MSQLSLVIKALGVEKVVWIDDMFASVGQSVTPDAIDLATKVSERNLFAEIGHPEIAEEEDKVTALVSVLESDAALLEKTTKILGGGELRDQARELMVLMKCLAEEKSGSDWQGVLSGKLPAYKNTLFLVDRNFSGEGITGDQSDELLKRTIGSYLTKESSNYCVVLTKEVGADEEVKSRASLLGELLDGTAPDNEALLRFSVIAKSKLATEPEAILSKNLRDKLAGVVLYALLEQVEQSLENSKVALREMLVSEFADINKAVLHNSYQEGASELDVLLRILQQKHRLELAKSFQPKSNDALRRVLARFRLFQLDAESDDDTGKHTISGELTTLCRAEVLTHGTLINQMMLPIVPGDVFVPIESGRRTQKEMTSWRGDLEPDKEYLMLLGQLCDIVPRGTSGQSASNMAFLAKFSVKPSKNHDSKVQKGQLHSGRIGWTMVGDLALHFDFREVMAANIAALQLCSFNKFGGAYISEDDTVEDVWSLASVARAKKNALKSFAGGKAVPSELNYYALGFRDNDLSGALKVQTKAGVRFFSYPVRRVCRVRDVEASEALGALERYWRRPAKPHDFTH